MCGIAGIVSLAGNRPPDRERLEEMCQTIRHRGPDAQAVDIRQGVGLGMRRLAIIDLEGGKQPLYNEDHSVRVVFNGEIYNFRQLRAELVALGHRFSTQTDGEVIVHLWEEFGPDFLSHLNGMFAIALHDLERRLVFLARDRLGIKPLFYAEDSGYLVFASEIKALLDSRLVERELDADSLGQFLAWEYVPAPRTLFRKIFKLEAGTCLTADLASGHLLSSRWWSIAGTNGVDPPSGEPDRSPAEWEEMVDRKIAECVQRQLVSDVPLGAFLSGGIDSSLVVGDMGPARTFSIGFDDPTYNETAWAAKIAAHLDVSHRVEIIEPQVGDLFDLLMRYMEDPIGDFSIFPTYLVSRLAREEVTVALSGDGGDELFGGYETYVAQRGAALWSWLPSTLRRGVIERGIRALRPRPAKRGLVNKAKRFVEGLDHPAALGHARWRLFGGGPMLRELFSPEAAERLETPLGAHIERLRAEASGLPAGIDRELYVDLKSYLVDNCLVKVDRMSMACSLEARVPLLDHELVELAFRVPGALKVRRGRTKVLLKRVAARHLPRECVYRPKQGFSIPIKHWIRTALRPLLEELLDPRRLHQQGIFRAEAVERLKAEHLAGRANHSHILWALMVFQDWASRWRVL